MLWMQVVNSQIAADCLNHDNLSSLKGWLCLPGSHLCHLFSLKEIQRIYIYILYIHAFRDQKALMPCFDIFLSKKRWLIYLFFSSNTTKTIRPTLLMQLSLFAMCDVSAFQSWSHVISCHDLSLKLYVYIIDIVIPWYRCSFCSPQTPSQQAPIARLVASLPFVQLRDLQGAK